jgi:hypothetical protein
MSRRRQQRRADKARRHPEPPRPPEGPPPPAETLRPTRPLRPAEPPGEPSPSRVVLRQADVVVRLAYSRTQAAEALGISRSSLRRLLPYLETIETPSGRKLIPVDELKRLVAEQRQAALARRPHAPPGRKPVVPPKVAARIRVAHAAGRSFREIADALNADGTPTAHGGQCWWPSTVRSVLGRGVEAD